MYKLTKIRETKAASILERAYQSLVNKGSFEVHSFERELRTCWNIGYHELYDVMEDALKDEKWKYVAVYYMERVNGPSPTCELKHALAKAYGVHRWNMTEDGRKARMMFWKKSGIKVV